MQWHLLENNITALEEKNALQDKIIHQKNAFIQAVQELKKQDIPLDETPKIMQLAQEQALSHVTWQALDAQHNLLEAEGSWVNFSNYAAQIIAIKNPPKIEQFHLTIAPDDTHLLQCALLVSATEKNHQLNPSPPETPPHKKNLSTPEDPFTKNQTLDRTITLDDLTWVGVLQQGGRYIAVAQQPDHTTFEVTAQSVLFQKWYVTEIDNHKICFHQKAAADQCFPL